MDNYKNKVEIINKLFFMLEDTLLYKINESDEYSDLIITRKMLLKFLKNQKTILIMTMESKQ